MHLASSIAREQRDGHQAIPTEHSTAVAAVATKGHGRGGLDDGDAGTIDHSRSGRGRSTAAGSGLGRSGFGAKASSTHATARLGGIGAFGEACDRRKQREEAEAKAAAKERKQQREEAGAEVAESVSDEE